LRAERPAERIHGDLLGVGWRLIMAGPGTQVTCLEKRPARLYKFSESCPGILLAQVFSP
jgi:hypothetical protein